MRRVGLVLNPVAGRGTAEDDAARLTKLLGERFELAVFETCASRDADACAKAALAARPPLDLVVAAGGDGTVSMVAGALVGTGVPLGIVARGTSNSIAAALGIPTDEEGALATLADGDVRVVDTARANGRAMLLHASVGLHAATVAGTERDAKHRWGALAYVAEGLANLADLTEFEVELETEAGSARCRAVNVTVANAAPQKTVLAQGPAEVTPDDGALDVTVVAASGFAEAVATGLHLLKSAVLGEAATRDNVGFFRARRVRVRAIPTQPILIDGEPAGEGELVVTCVPRSLRVLVPRA